MQKRWEADGEISGHVNPLPGGAYELQVRQLSFGVISVYSFRPAATGSAVSWWPRDGFVNNATRQALELSLARCAT